MPKTAGIHHITGGYSVWNTIFEISISNKRLR